MAFHGKVALVTGGASGMGRIAALQLAALGAKVAIVDLNDDKLSFGVRRARNYPFKCDTSDLAQVQQVVADVEANIGAIDRLTIALAIMPGQSIKDMSAEATNGKMMAINYGGTVNMVKTVWPLMEARGSGDIIMFGSMAGDVLTHNLGAYSATKSATNTWAVAMIHENKASPIRFLLVCPPMVKTPLVDQAMQLTR